MLVYRRTDLFSSPAQTLVNTVNCVGVMGKGIAKEFKKREPDMFVAYKKICDEKRLTPGNLWLWRGESNLILNFPTKIHWKSPSKIEWIEAGLKKFVTSYEKAGIKEISFPRLGCGNGGLDWDEVRPLMERYLAPLPIHIYIHDYTVDVGLPEYLEHVANQLHDFSKELSFDNFLDGLVRAIDVSEGCLVDIVTGKPIKVCLNDEILRIETDHSSFILERDDLRSAWIGLLNGLLMKEQVGSELIGSPLLSLVSILPQARPIQIRRSDRENDELAVELAPNNHGVVSIPQVDARQTEMAWH